MSVASPYPSDNCQTGTKPQLMTTVVDGSQTPLFMPIASMCSPTGPSRSSMTSSSPTSITPSEASPEAHTDSIIQNHTPIGSGSETEERSESNTLSTLEITVAKHLDKLSPVKRLPTTQSPVCHSIQSLRNHGLSCPCGSQFTDTPDFMHHAAQCNQFAKTVSTFAENVVATTMASPNASRISVNHSPLSMQTGSPNMYDGDVDSHKGIPYKRESSYCSPETVTKSNGIFGSNGTHSALDLSVRPPGMKSEASPPKTTSLTCSECGRSFGTEKDQLFQHFESNHNQTGKFTCPCGQIYTLLANLLKHRFNCLAGRRDSTDSTDTLTTSPRINEHQHHSTDVHRSRGLDSPYSNWLPETHTSMRQLSCTGCGKSGFHSPSDLFTHFTMCTQMAPRFGHHPSLYVTRSDEQHRLLRQSPTICSKQMDGNMLGSWKSSPGSSYMSNHQSSKSIPRNMVNNSQTPKRHESTNLPMSAPRLPMGLIQPPPPQQQQPQPPSSLPQHMGGYVSNGKNITSMNPYLPHGLVYSTAATTTSHTQLTASAKSTTHRGNPIKPTDCKSYTGLKQNPNECPVGQQQITDLSRPFKCCNCIKAFKSKALLDQHMHIHYPPKYTCRYCAKKYRWPPVFYHHQRTCKKRPPSTTVTSTDGTNSTTISSNCSLNSRPSDSTYNSSTTTSSSSNTNGQPYSSSQAFNPYGLRHSGSIPNNTPITSHLSVANIPDLLLNSGGVTSDSMGPFPGMDSMGFAAFAAAAAAMGMRIPLPPIPPPLGLPASFQSGVGSYGHSFLPSTSMAAQHHTGQISPFASTGLFPPLLSPSIPAHSPNGGMSVNSTVSTAHDATVGGVLPFNSSIIPGTPSERHNTATTRTTEHVQAPIKTAGLSCVCGMSFDVLTNYWVHLANCALLQQLVSLGSIRKTENGSEQIPLLPCPNLPLLPPLLPGLLPDVEQLQASGKDTIPSFPFITNHKRESAEHAMQLTMDRLQPQLPPTQPTTLDPTNLFSSAMNAAMHTAAMMQHKQRRDPINDSSMDSAVSNITLSATEQSKQIWNGIKHGLMSQQLKDQGLERSQSDNHISDISGLIRREHRQHCDQEEHLHQSVKRMKSEQTEGKETKADISFQSIPTSLSFDKPLGEMIDEDETENDKSKLNQLSNSGSTSLMAAMATVLANAAAAAGFQCSGSINSSPSTTSNDRYNTTPGEMDERTTPEPSLCNGFTPMKLCMQCGKEFSSRPSLKQHIEGKHSVEGKYRCPGCAKRYRWGASYYYHKKSCRAMQETSPTLNDSGLPCVTMHRDNTISPPTPNGSPSSYNCTGPLGEFDLPHLTARGEFMEDRGFFSPQPEHRQEEVYRSQSGSCVEMASNSELMDSEPVDGVRYAMNKGDWPNSSPINCSVDMHPDSRMDSVLGADPVDNRPVS